MQGGHTFFAVLMSLFILGIFTFLVFMAGLALTAPLKLSRRAKICLAALAFFNLAMQVEFVALSYKLAHLDQVGQSHPTLSAFHKVLGGVITFPVGLLPHAYRIPEPVFFSLNATVWSALVIYLFAGLQRLRNKFTEPCASPNCDPLRGSRRLSLDDRRR